MKKDNIFKIKLFLLGIGLAMVFHCAVPSEVMAYGAPYDGFVINEDGTIIAPGGAGYPTLYYNGDQWWPYPPPPYTGPNSYYPYGGFGYQQPYNPYVNPYKDGYNPYLDDDYEPPPDFSNWIWTDPWTAYDPSGGGAVAVNWQPEYIGTSPYFQQNSINPWSQPYNYGWNMPFGYGRSQPYFGGYQQRYYPSYPYPGIPYGNDMVGYPQSSFNPYQWIFTALRSEW